MKSCLPGKTSEKHFRGKIKSYGGKPVIPRQISIREKTLAYVKFFAFLTSEIPSGMI
jgi:hypothetical protein